MALTLLLTFICIAGVFLMLFAAVAFIQDKKFFGTAPKLTLKLSRTFRADCEVMEK